MHLESGCQHCQNK